jgi:hypothetical protein
MQTIRCYINHIDGYISLGSQRDLILEHIKKKYQVTSNEINDVLGTELTISGENVTMDYSPLIPKKAKETYISIKGSKFTLINPPGKKKIQVIWYFDKVSMGINGEFVNLLYDRQDTDEILTTDFNIPRLLPDLSVDYQLITPESQEEELVDEILKMQNEYNFSYRKIAEEIKQKTGIAISHTKVMRTLHKHSAISKP